MFPLQLPDFIHEIVWGCIRTLRSMFMLGCFWYFFPTQHNKMNPLKFLFLQKQRFPFEPPQHHYRLNAYVLNERLMPDFTVSSWYLNICFAPVTSHKTFDEALSTLETMMLSTPLCCERICFFVGLCTIKQETWSKSNNIRRLWKRKTIQDCRWHAT